MASLSCVFLYFMTEYNGEIISDIIIYEYRKVDIDEE